MNKADVDINSILVKPIYIGLLINVFVPAAVLLIAYYMEQSGDIVRQTPSATAAVLFWFLVALSVIEGGVAVFIKQKMFNSPMVFSRESFIEDLGRRTFQISIVIYSITSAISIYGFVIYLIGGTFQQLLLFVFISFVAFQLIRPRYRFMERVITTQIRLAESGQFMTGKN